MRIFTVDSARGWSSDIASGVDLSLGLAEKGHEVAVVCHPKSAIRSHLAGDRRVTLKPIAIRSQLNVFRVLQLANLNHRAAPDVVLATRPNDVTLSVAARRLLGRFPIVHRHASASLPQGGVLYRRFWARELQALVVNSWTARRRLLESAPWLRSVAIHVIHDGTDVSRFRPRPGLRQRARAELGIPEDAFIISFHGAIEPSMRVELLIRAVAALPVGLKVHALIVGRGPALPDLRRLAAELRAPVIFSEPGQDLSELLSAADAAADLSTAAEFSDRAVEAMACGLPVVLSETPSHTEQVEDGAQGVLVPPDSRRELADAIRWLANDPQGRARMGKAAHERVKTELGREQMIDRYEAMLRSTLENFKA